MRFRRIIRCPRNQPVKAQQHGTFAEAEFLLFAGNRTFCGILGLGLAKIPPSQQLNPAGGGHRDHRSLRKPAFATYNNHNNNNALGVSGRGLPASGKRPPRGGMGLALLFFNGFLIFSLQTVADGRNFEQQEVRMREKIEWIDIAEAALCTLFAVGFFWVVLWLGR
jgi:hypothetical protein